MIVLLDPRADEAAVQAIIDRARELGLDARPLAGRKGQALVVSGPELGRALELRGTPGVTEILTRRRRLGSGEPLWPHFSLRLGMSLLLLLALLALLAGFLPPGLGNDADVLGPAANLPAMDWYLRPPAALSDFAPGIGALLLGVLWALMILLPLIDRADASTPHGRLFVLSLRAAGVLVIASLVILGVV